VGAAAGGGGPGRRGQGGVGRAGNEGTPLKGAPTARKTRGSARSLTRARAAALDPALLVGSMWALSCAQTTPTHPPASFLVGLASPKP
jgi:hypothetical protein